MCWYRTFNVFNTLSETFPICLVGSKCNNLWPKLWTCYTTGLPYIRTTETSYILNHLATMNYDGFWPQIASLWLLKWLWPLITTNCGGLILINITVLVADDKTVYCCLGWQHYQSYRAYLRPVAAAGTVRYGGDAGHNNIHFVFIKTMKV